jgi:hypothetical protein
MQSVRTDIHSGVEAGHGAGCLSRHYFGRFSRFVGMTGFKNQFFNDSQVVGFGGPTWYATVKWEVELERWLRPFLDRLRQKARGRVCPLYISGLIGAGDRKSVQPMDHFVAAGVWDAGAFSTVCWSMRPDG